MSPFLTDAEVLEICDPLVQKAAMVKYLRQQGWTVNLKPSGMPLITRAHAEEMGAKPKPRQETPQAPDAPKLQPTRAAFLQLVESRQHGSKKKVQPA